MNIKISLENSSDPQTIENVIKLDHLIFNSGKRTEDKIRKEFSLARNLVTLFAYDGDKIIGFKVGYEETPGTFYSWIGGVLPTYRGVGVASTLMQTQHKHLKELGHTHVTTKSGNEFKAMMSLNLKFGFDIIGVHINKKNELRVHFRKAL